VDKVISLVEESLRSLREGSSDQMIYKKVGPLSYIEIQSEDGTVIIKVVDNSEV